MASGEREGEAAGRCVSVLLLLLGLGRAQRDAPAFAMRLPPPGDWVGTFRAGHPRERGGRASPAPRAWERTRVSKGWWGQGDRCGEEGGVRNIVSFGSGRPEAQAGEDEHVVTLRYFVAEIV